MHTYIQACEEKMNEEERKFLTSTTLLQGNGGGDAGEGDECRDYFQVGR